MRVRVLTLLSTLLVSVSAWAQQANPAPLDLPVSMQKIREGVARAGPEAPLKGLDMTGQPTFHVDVTEQQKFEETLPKIRFEASGPIVAGGVDAYDQQQRLFPPINNPLVQPYAAFTTGQVITVGVEALLEQYAGESAVRAIDAELKAHAERDARDEVARSLAEYWHARIAASASADFPPPKD